MINYQTPLGVVTLSSELLEAIVGIAVNDCFGVAGMAAKDTVDSLVSLIRKSRVDKGVKVVPVGEEMLSIELHIVVIYGLNISAIAQSIMHKVKYTVEDLTGMTVHEVVVFVDGMKA